ncbi:calcium/sodium antiporter [Pseudoruegeria sp. SHC-113]|uniref:calcium/sodium antiporter n=1 Tax=Pseudoruegeria sp. SHC-113 TaxID=2855439 RepID=UPI0021BB1A11|nr:calcium/sodium antiporter [Pseudoruegeria sp. SHC-113]MCT8161658.1 calcium/sodium antiporter [Pseudoruegeria sp. SHC-113]
MDWLYVAVGLVILLLGGDALVRGAVNLSLRLGVPALIVSLTIVAFGTSAPELLISVGAVMEGVPGLALGNVIGSNTANILLVLGLPALLAPMHTSECDSRKTYLFMIAASLLFIVLCFLGPITWWHALILLAGLAVVLGDAFRDAMRHRENGAACAMSEGEEEVEGADPEMSGTKIAIYIILGLIGLPLGAELLVEGAENIARTFGVPETVIGLTLVALGTSLPELATTIMAALRRQADVALGNVIGSNMFNLLAIMGITGLVGPLPVDPGLLHFDLWVMLGASLLLAPFVFMKLDITRGWGLLLTALYLAYVGRFFLL